MTGCLLSRRVGYKMGMELVYVTGDDTLVVMCVSKLEDRLRLGDDLTL